MRPTVKECRERELVRLVRFKTNAPTEEDFAEARRLMNSFYRLCGLAETNLYLTNDSRRHNLPSTRKSEEREHEWWKRLDGEFNRIYGLNLVYCGFMPSIVTKHENGGVREEIQRFFYE